MWKWNFHVHIYMIFGDLHEMGHNVFNYLKRKKQGRIEFYTINKRELINEEDKINLN